MSNRQLRDSFLQLLSTELAGITIHPIRRELNRPDAQKPQINAVNVEFTVLETSVQTPEQDVSISVIHEDELTAVDWVNQLTDLLNKRSFTEKYDYTNPASPVRANGLISWPTRLRFRPVFNPFYFNLNCRFSIRHIN
jgi:hypothetical protein